MQRMGGISCWRNGRGSRSDGPRGHSPDNPFPTFRPDRTGRGGGRDRHAGGVRPVGHASGTAAVPDRGQIGSLKIGPLIFRLPLDALHGVTGPEGEGRPGAGLQ